MTYVIFSIDYSFTIKWLHGYFLLGHLIIYVYMTLLLDFVITWKIYGIRFKNDFYNLCFDILYGFNKFNS